MTESLPRAPAVAAFAIGAAVLACSAPLVAYAGSLALFGLPHGLAELRYVDGRFARRIGFRRGAAILGILTGAVGLRGLGLAHLVDPSDAYVAELGLVALLALAVVPDLTSSPARAALALGVGGAIATGSWFAPWATIALLAVLHNATPVGFLAERLTGTDALAPVMVACSILFLAVPIGIATGVLPHALNGMGVHALEPAWPTVGPLSDHLRVFVPAGWVDPSTAPRLFAAAAYLQLLHYGAVLGLLPRLLRARSPVGDRPVLPWPAQRGLALAICGAGVLATLAFARDFVGTRAVYGLVAALHAWIEIPVLLLGLSPAACLPAHSVPAHAAG